MWQVSNKFRKVSMGFSLLATAGLVLAPVTVFATPDHATTTKTTESPFCTNLSTEISTINTKISTLQSKMTTARTQRGQNITADYAKWDAAVLAARAKADQERQADFTQLNAKGQTAAEKTAIATFETAVTNAVNTKRTANNTAVSVYRSGVSVAIANQVNTVNNQVTIFTNAVDSAESTAQASCQTTPSTTHDVFRTAMKSAQAAFLADRPGDSGLSSEIKQLGANRNAAITQNDATFQATVTSAIATLKAAFGSSSSSI